MTIDPRDLEALKKKYPTLGEESFKLAEVMANLRKSQAEHRPAPAANVRPSFGPSIGVKTVVGHDGQGRYYFPDPEATNRFVDSLIQRRSRVITKSPGP